MELAPPPSKRGANDPTADPAAAADDTPAARTGATPELFAPPEPGLAPRPEPARAPFPALERITSRYRADVNRLAPPAAPAALDALEGHLERPLPPELRGFLGHHNGATLFRDTLRIRSSSEITVAADHAPGVVLFADQPDLSWGFGRDAVGYAFGTWDGERLEPVYASFAAWLEAEIARIETRVARPADVEALRREIAPADRHLLVRAGRIALAEGRPEEAERALDEATRRSPGDPRAWQLLGDALSARDRHAARQAWLTAVRRTRLPLPFPGAPCIDAELLGALDPSRDGAAGPDADVDWERELTRFLAEIADVTDRPSLAVACAAACQLARVLARRGRRAAARDVLDDTLTRANQFRVREPAWPVIAELVQLEIGLGHHDAAEALLRKARGGPPEVRAEAHLRLAEIAVQRQEPWAEEALTDAFTAGLDDGGRARAALLRIERAIRQQRPDDAERAADGIERMARRAGSRLIEAGAALAAGDVARVRGRPEDAERHYQRAFELARDRDAETVGRVLVRRAELAWAAGRNEEALRMVAAAAATFRTNELPVREGWALLRLARFTTESDPARAQQLRAAARERFVAADLAAGVAAVDSAGGDAGSSLGWHLERASAHARARHDAQRARPPWDPSDAERPERRLAAHRLAIAACDTGVVTALAKEMEACARAASVGRGRPTDPPVLRYVAAVDLLSGHRSYEAARVLLDHLFVKGIDGVMLRALQGAIARSPNAALVDGLLRCVEAPTERPADAVSAAAELLGLRRESAAVRPLVAVVRATGMPAARRAGLTALGRIGDRSVVDALLPALDDPRLAEQAALGLLMLGERCGVDFHGRALVDGRTDLSGSPGEIVGRYGGPDHLLLLIRAAESDGDHALGALQGLGLLGDPRAVPTLLQALHTRNRRVAEVASGALSILSGRPDDPAEPGLRARWQEWWSKAEAELPAGMRHRLGQPYRCGQLVDAMTDPDPYVRRTAYDELVIASGEALPFDAEGPWRVQQAHLADWRRWWGRAADRLPPGRWLLDGRVLA